MKRKLKAIALGLLVLILGAALYVFIYLKGTLPPVSGEYPVDSLKSEVSVKRNGYGIPRIEAESLEEMYFAVGFVHASDRLFQMDLIRRMATGRLSEIFGKKALQTDIYYKDLMIEESIENSLKQEIDQKLKRYMERYCEGINWFIRNRTLPPEFRLLGYKPEPWTLSDAMSIFKNMENILAGSGNELNNLKIRESFGDRIGDKLIKGKFGTTIINIDEYNQFFENSSLAKAAQGESDRIENGIGSNNWVVSGKRTRSGLPLLANDPHLGNVFPSYFYQLYASAEGMEFSGNTIPGVPFIIIGRNNQLGWGFTNVGTDVIDYFELVTNNPGKKYRLDGEWKSFEVLRKTIRIKGEKDHIHEIKISDYGPVFQEGGRYFARHSVMMYKSTVLEAFFRMNFSLTVPDFLSALKLFSSPAQNVVFADKGGTIGYYPTGRIPKRRFGDGGLPVKIERLNQLWDGFIDESQKPFLINPEKGYIVTANNPVLPEGKLPLYAVKWYPSFRADRISTLLQNEKKLDMVDMLNIQRDSHLPGAQFLMKQMRGMTFSDNHAKSLQDIFIKWDLKADSSIAPALFYRFQTRLAQLIFEDHLTDRNNTGLISYYWLYRILNYPDFRVSPLAGSLLDNIETKEIETLKDLMEKALSQCYREYLQEGSDNFQWGKVHNLSYQHPLGSVPVIKGLLNRGPYSVKGGRDCVQIASFRRGTFNVSHLSTFRMVIDFADFSQSMMVNSSGQSGHFMSDFYDDQIDLYVNLKYREMEDFTSTRHRLILKPGNPN